MTLPRTRQARPVPEAIPAALQRAHWIWPAQLHYDLQNSFAQFRRPFALKQRPRRAILFITADQSYQLNINGTFVTRGPARGYQSSWPYDRIDIAPWLRRGDNVLAVRVHNSGKSSFQYVHQGFAGLLAALELPGAKIVSDAGWHGRLEQECVRDTVPMSLQLPAQEHFDGRKAPGDWTRVEFAPAPGEWTGSRMRPWNSAPWFQLEPRGIPLLRETVRRLPVRLGEATGACGPGYRSVRDVVALRKNLAVEAGVEVSGTVRQPRVRLVSRLSGGFLIGGGVWLALARAK